MPRNNLKRLPVAFLRRGMAHFHPGCSTPDRRPIESRSADAEPQAEATTRANAAQAEGTTSS